MSVMLAFKNYQWRKMAKNGEKWRKMAMANLPFSFVKFAISPLAPPPYHPDLIFDIKGGGAMAKNGEKWRIMAMANSAFSFVKFAIFRQFLILEFHI